MDDNYSSELAALERLAHAEEAERQRVVEVIIRGIGSDYYSAYEEATEAFATYRARFEALERENARLLAFVENLATYTPLSVVFDDWNKGVVDNRITIAGEAAALLSELSGKSEVADGE